MEHLAIVKLNLQQKHYIPFFYMIFTEELRSLRKILIFEKMVSIWKNVKFLRKKSMPERHIKKIDRRYRLKTTYFFRIFNINYFREILKLIGYKFWKFQVMPISNTTFQEIRIWSFSLSYLLHGENLFLKFQSSSWVKRGHSGFWLKFHQQLSKKKLFNL